MNEMPEKFYPPSEGEPKAIKSKEKLIPIEDFQPEFKEQFLYLLDEEGMTDFNNEAHMAIFLERLADYWQRQENKEFVLFHKFLGSGAAGVDAWSAKEKSRLLNLFNRSLVNDDRDLPSDFLAQYVEGYPNNSEKLSEYAFFKPLSKDEAKNLSIPKKDFKGNELESVRLSFDLYLDYLSALRDVLKRDLYKDFLQEMEKKSTEEFDDTEKFATWYENKNKDKENSSDADNSEESAEEMVFLSFDEVESLLAKEKELKNKKGQKSQDNNDGEAGFTKEERKFLNDYLADWKHFLYDNSDWRKVSSQFQNILTLKRKLQDKGASLYQERAAFIRNPEAYAEKIKNDDLHDYWFGDFIRKNNINTNRLTARLSNEDKEKFLAAFKADRLTEFTAVWASDLLKSRVETLARKSGYLKANPDKRLELENLVQDLLAYWPDDLSLYNENELDSIIHEWFAPFVPGGRGEDESGKFIRADYLLRTADNPKTPYFVEDDKSFNILLGEINELTVKEIRLKSKEFKAIKNILNDNGYGKILESARMESLLADIYEYEDLEWVQEDLWNELLENLGDYLVKEIQVYVENDEVVAADWQTLGNFEKKLNLKTKSKAKALKKYTVEDLRLMHDYYKELKEL